MGNEFFGQGQANSDGGSAAELAGEKDGAAASFDDGFCNGQTQAGAAGAAGS